MHAALLVCTCGQFVFLIWSVTAGYDNIRWIQLPHPRSNDREDAYSFPTSPSWELSSSKVLQASNKEPLVSPSHPRHKLAQDKVVRRRVWWRSPSIGIFRGTLRGRSATPGLRTCNRLFWIVSVASSCLEITHWDTNLVSSVDLPIPRAPCTCLCRRLGSIFSTKPWPDSTNEVGRYIRFRTPY